jgi:hypothetical protein
MTARYITAEKVDQLVYSPLADDPDYGELVDLFVQEIPERINALDAQAESRDWNQLAETAHKLKGAAGCYGFGEITLCAARLYFVGAGDTAADCCLERREVFVLGSQFTDTATS